MATPWGLVVSTALSDIGDPSAPVGSPAWCKYAHIGLREQKQRAQSQVSSLKYGLISFKNDGRWNQLTDQTGHRFISWENYITCPEPWGLGMRLDIARAVMQEQDDTALLGDVMRRAEQAQKLDTATPDLKAPHRPKKSGNKNSVTRVSVGESNDAAYALARLRKDRPDIHERVLAGEISPHAGMIEAGFRKITRKKLTRVERELKRLGDMTKPERREIWKHLRKEFGN
jgi:hypothetical protein